ncbi:MAG: metallophosphoesterase [Clostridia bacterium]|nr:metallophosphoesterase [Clostridia bacterium]
MKKRFIFLFAAALALCACVQQNPEETSVPEQTPLTVEISIPAATALPAVEQEHSPVPVSASPSPTETPLPEPTEGYEAPAGVQTVAWLTDTQHYSNTFPEIYPIMTGFLRDNAEKMNLVYVVHTGDLVHRNANIDNWEVARAAQDLINDIPNGVLAGNHDMEPSTGGYENYYTYFGKDKYDSQPCYGESFQNNRGHYDLVTISGRDYIFVYMSHAPDEKALSFIRDSFNKYPDRPGILCLHDFITTEGTLSEAGEEIRQKVVAQCPNIYMVLCGHRYGLYTLVDAFDDDGDGVQDRTVYEIMMNYQAAGKEGGSGYLRLMQFDEGRGEVRCINYSPYLNDYNWLDDPNHKEPRYEMDDKSESFVLPMPWK